MVKTIRIIKDLLLIIGFISVELRQSHAFPCCRCRPLVLRNDYRRTTSRSSVIPATNLRSLLTKTMAVTPNYQNDNNSDMNTLRSINSRRNILKRSISASTAVWFLPFTAPLRVANAFSKSRTDEYPIQRTDEEWANILSGPQYFILREGGTERPYSSILEPETRSGWYVCAGCDTPLFESAKKFHSGTGWPSFADVIQGNVEDVYERRGKTEVRCSRCGGHLGDVFFDGFLFVTTPAFFSGKRYCIDGAALIFRPKDGTDSINGDVPPQGRERWDYIPF